MIPKILDHHQPAPSGGGTTHLLRRIQLFLGLVKVLWCRADSEKVSHRAKPELLTC